MCDDLSPQELDEGVETLADGLESGRLQPQAPATKVALDRLREGRDKAEARAKELEDALDASQYELGQVGKERDVFLAERDQLGRIVDSLTSRCERLSHEKWVQQTSADFWAKKWYERVQADAECDELTPTVREALDDLVWALGERVRDAWEALKR